MFRRRQPADADAFGAEVLSYLEPLYATALRLTRNRADAEDLVQDTLVKAFRFSDKFEPGTNLRAWLSTILHNTWRNRVRDAGREAVEVDSTRLEEAEAADGASGSFAPHSTSCRMSFARRSGCATSKSSHMRRSRRCSMCRSEP
jgi:RNA polymerase sigma-70 factor (ECF subfamily)